MRMQSKKPIAIEPRLDLFAFFDGASRGSGIFEDRFGRLRRAFTVDLQGRRAGDDGFVLEEDFAYADGARQRRVWRLRRTGPDSFEGRADDVIGVAVGRSAGNAVHMRYAMALPIGRSTWTVDFEDRMDLQADGVLLSRSRVSKWGLELGQVALAFRRTPMARADLVDAAQ